MCQNVKKIITLITLIITTLITSSCQDDWQEENPWEDNAELLFWFGDFEETTHILGCFRLSPDRTRLAFKSINGENNSHQFWTMSLDFNDLVLVYETPPGTLGHTLYFGGWSNDGNYLLYTQCFDEYPYSSELRYISTKSGEQTIIEFPDYLQPVYCEWSPIDDWIGFLGINVDTDCSDLYIVRPDGTELTQITFNNNGLGQPRWSPDGEYFIGSDSDDVDCSEIFKVDVSSGERIKVTDTPGYYCDNGVWSPSGEWIAYSKELPFGHEEWEPKDIWITKADCSFESYHISNSYPDDEPTIGIIGDEPEFWDDELGIVFVSDRFPRQYIHYPKGLYQIDPKEGEGFQ